MTAKSGRRLPRRGGTGAAYVRDRDLPRLTPLWPAEIADTSPAGLTQLVARLSQALRRERQRGLARHWSYDLARHRSLVIATREERARLLAVTTERSLATTGRARRRAEIAITPSAHSITTPSITTDHKNVNL